MKHREQKPCRIFLEVKNETSPYSRVCSRECVIRTHSWSLMFEITKKNVQKSECTVTVKRRYIFDIQKISLWFLLSMLHIYCVPTATVSLIGIQTIIMRPSGTHFPFKNWMVPQIAIIKLLSRVVEFPLHISCFKCIRWSWRGFDINSTLKNTCLSLWIASVWIATGTKHQEAHSTMRYKIESRSVRVRVSQSTVRVQELFKSV